MTIKLSIILFFFSVTCNAKYTTSNIQHKTMIEALFEFFEANKVTFLNDNKTIEYTDREEAKTCIKKLNVAKKNINEPLQETALKELKIINDTASYLSSSYLLTDHKGNYW